MTSTSLGATAAPRSPYAVLRSRSFTLLWVGQFVSTAGDALTTLAAAILIYRVTNSAFSVGLMLIATALPTLFVGLLAGVLVDRFRPARFMIAADLARAALSFLIPVLVLGVPISLPLAGAVWLYALIVLSGAATQFFEPAFSSMLPETIAVADLASANALMQLSGFGATAIGFAASGLIAARLPIEWAFYLDALSFMVSAGCIALARLPNLAPGARTSGFAVIANLRAGAQYASGSPILRAFWVVSVPAFFSLGLINACLLPYAAEALHATSFVYGLLEGLTSVGFVTGSLLLVRLADRVHEGQLVTISLLGLAVSLLLLAPISLAVAAIALVMLSGVFTAPLAVARAVVVQRNAPREMRGRVFSAFFVTRSLVGVAGMAAGGLADIVGVRWLVAASGLVLLLGAAVTLAIPGLRLGTAEWRRAASLVRAAGMAAGPVAGQPATLADFDLLLGHVPAFAGVSQADRLYLVGQSRSYALPAGTTVVRQGDTGSSAYFILAGRVAVGLASVSEIASLALLSAGDFFGEIAALTAMPRTANVVTDQASLLLEVPADVIRRLMRTPAINRLLLSAMTERLAALNLVDLPRYASLDQQVMTELRQPAPAPAEVTVPASDLGHTGDAI